MLIFFLIAGTVSPPLDANIDPVETRSAEPAPPPDMLALRADGTLVYREKETTLAQHLQSRAAGEGPIRLFVDRNLQATRLVEIAAMAKALSERPVVIVTRRVQP